MRSLTFALGLLIACSGAPAEGTGPLPGSFHYTALDTMGHALLAGQVVFTFPDDSTLTGRWTIAWLPGADTTIPVGPQVGSGVLVGTSRGDTLLVQLNPTNADHNVALLAVPAADGYSGQWQWITATGPRTWGTFVAVP